jgi:hypothetical protein
MADAAAVPELEPLFAWVRAAGGDLDAVRVGVTASGRGVFAARDLVAGEVVLRVPSACFLTPADGARTALGQQVERGWDLPAREPALLAALLVTGDAADHVDTSGIST